MRWIDLVPRPLAPTLTSTKIQKLHIQQSRTTGKTKSQRTGKKYTTKKNPTAFVVGPPKISPPRRTRATNSSLCITRRDRLTSSRTFQTLIVSGTKYVLSVSSATSTEESFSGSCRQQNKLHYLYSYRPSVGLQCVDNTKQKSFAQVSACCVSQIKHAASANQPISVRTGLIPQEETNAVRVCSTKTSQNPPPIKNSTEVERAGSSEKKMFHVCRGQTGSSRSPTQASTRWRRGTNCVFILCSPASATLAGRRQPTTGVGTAHTVISYSAATACLK